MEHMTVKEIKAVADTLPKERYLEFIEQLLSDRRGSVRKLALTLSKKLDRLERERERLTHLFDLEEHFRRRQVFRIGGVDEAGRGPLAGPVVAACVLFDENPFIEGINDSKKLSEEKREQIFEQIISQAVSYGIGMADHREIDKFNILEATMLAMRRAIAACTVRPEFLLVDGNQMIRQMDCPQKTVVQGDAKSVSIAAASILAKVTRDRWMKEMAKRYPQYGFEKHKGYGTEEHRRVLLEQGPCEIHRMSFVKNLIV